MASSAVEQEVIETMGQKVLAFHSPIVGALLRNYRGLTQQGKIGLLLVFFALWHRFGGKLLVKNGKIIHFLPSCKFQLLFLRIELRWKQILN
jgi:hypothetical protein